MSGFEDILKSFSDFFKEFLSGSNASYGMFGFIFLAVWMFFYSLFDTLAVNIFKKNPRSSNKFSLSLSFVLALIFVFFLGVESKTFDIKMFYDNLKSLVFVLSFIPAGIFLIVQGFLKKKHQDEIEHFKVGQFIYGFYGLLGSILLLVAFNQITIIKKLFTDSYLEKFNLEFILILICLFIGYFLILIVNSIFYKRKINDEKFSSKTNQIHKDLSKNDETLNKERDNKDILRNLNRMIMDEGNFTKDEIKLREIFDLLYSYLTSNQKMKVYLLNRLNEFSKIIKTVNDNYYIKNYDNFKSDWKNFYNSENNS